MKNSAFLLILAFTVLAVGCGKVSDPAQSPSAPTMVMVNVIVTPESASLSIGTTQQFTANDGYISACAADNVIDPSWEATGGIGTINPAGLFTAISAGSGEVIARIGTFEGKASVTVSVPPDTTPPARPAGLSASGSINRISLGWTANGESDLQGYKIFRRLQGESDYRILTTVGKVSSFTDFGVPRSSGTHHYKIRAVDDSGNESEYSDDVSASPTIMLDAPVLSFNNISRTSARANWAAAANAASYLLSYGTDTAASNLGSTTTTETTYTLTGLNSETIYYVKVKGQDGYPGLEGFGTFTTLLPNNIEISSITVDGIPTTSEATVSGRDAVIEGVVSVESGRTIASINLDSGDQGYLIKNDIGASTYLFTVYANLMRGQNEIIFRDTDSAGRTYVSDTIKLNASIPLYDVKIQLTWNGSQDADLRLVAPDGISLCNYVYRNPDWGVAGETTDNPKLDRDLTMGYGPEWISIQSPADGAYTVKAINYSGYYPVTFTVKVFIRDVLSRTFTHAFNDGSAGNYWTPCTITKSGSNIIVNTVDTVGSSGVRGLSVQERKP